MVKLDDIFVEIDVQNFNLDDSIAAIFQSGKRMRI